MEEKPRAFDKAARSPVDSGKGLDQYGLGSAPASPGRRTRFMSAG